MKLPLTIYIREFVKRQKIKIQDPNKPKSTSTKNSGTLTTEMFWNTFCWKYVLRNLTTGSQMMKTKNSKKICSMVLEKYDKH